MCQILLLLLNFLFYFIKVVAIVVVSSSQFVAFNLSLPMIRAVVFNLSLDRSGMLILLCVVFIIYQLAYYSERCLSSISDPLLYFSPQNSAVPGCGTRSQCKRVGCGLVPNTLTPLKTYTIRKCKVPWQYILLCCHPHQSYGANHWSSNGVDIKRKNQLKANG